MAKVLKAIVFELNGQVFGVDIGQVRSIERLGEITVVPGTPQFIKGVVHMRGKTTPIMDLKERLDLPEAESRSKADEKRMLIIQLCSVQAGLIVDAATDVIDINEEMVEPAPTMIGGVQKSYLKGVAKLESKLLVLLDLERILNEEEADEIVGVIK